MKLSAKLRWGIVLLMTSPTFCSLFAEPKGDSARVPITLDHNRIIIKVGVYLTDGSVKMINAWLDNGNPTMIMTERLARELKLKTSVDSLGTTKVVGNIPEKIQIGAVVLSLKDLLQPIEVENAKSIGAGLDADINIPSIVLKNYAIVIDYPAKKFTIGSPGSVRFQGNPVNGFFNSQNFLIQIPARVDSEEFNLALDVGTPVSFISGDLISKWSKVHTSWPSMRGAIGVANLWGTEDEPTWQLLRIDNLLYGGIALSNLIAVSCPQNWLEYFTNRVGIPTAGLIGAEALINYRVGIDYVHEKVYFQRIGNSVEADMDLVGLTLRPEPDGRYRILGVSDYKEKPSVEGILKGDILLKVNNTNVSDLTMGDVWSLLHGRPGTVRILILDRAGKQVTIKAKTHRFLSKSH